MRPVSFYQKASRILVIWMTTMAIITYLCLLADTVLCRQDSAYYNHNIFHSISEYVFLLGYFFFYFVMAFLFVSIDTPQEYQALGSETILQLSVIIVVIILILAGFYVLQSFFNKKGARICLGITMVLTIVDTVRVGLMAIYSILQAKYYIENMTAQSVILAVEGVLCILLHAALILCLSKSLKFTWKEYEHY